MTAQWIDGFICGMVSAVFIYLFFARIGKGSGENGRDTESR